MRKCIAFFALLFALRAQGQQEYITEKNIFYYPAARATDGYMQTQCRLDFYYPANAKNFATIIWFHGGGLTEGAKEIPIQLMKRGYAVVGVGYRFAPRVKAPAYIEDAAAAVAWVFQNVARYGGSRKRIIVSGHSAGGYLGMMLTLDKQYLASSQIDADSIALLVPFSGQAITHFTIRKEQGIRELQPVIDKYAPLFHVRSTAPPMLLITGDAELELMGRFDENAYLLRMMKLAGHTRTRLLQLQGFDHGSMRDAAFPLLLKEIAAVVSGKK